MVMLADNKLVATRASRRVLSEMLPPGVAQQAEEINGHVDWVALLRCLDGIYIGHGGGLGQVSYLNTPQDALDGRTPAETLAQPNGPQAFQDAARLWVCEQNAARRQRRRVIAGV